jgi:hypothetical protein
MFIRTNLYQEDTKRLLRTIYNNKVFLQHQLFYTVAIEKARLIYE